MAGARLRTLPLAIAPVALGTGAGVVAIADGPWHPARALLALVVALALQIGVNYANDYSDGVRGTDDHRVGPARLTGSGAAKPKHVLAVSLSFFALAALAGLALVVVTRQWWLLAVGAVAIVAAWFYTGGKHPYGYYGLGELFVFVFFGLVATAGSAYVQALTVNLEAWLGGVGAGLIACAVLMANNLRDVAQDKVAGKRTLAVLVGPLAGRILFVVFMLVPFAHRRVLRAALPAAWLVLLGAAARRCRRCLIVLRRRPRASCCSRCSSRASPRSSTASGWGWRSRSRRRRARADRPTDAAAHASASSRRSCPFASIGRVLCLVVVAHDRRLAVAGGVEVVRRSTRAGGAGRCSDALRPNRAATSGEIHGLTPTSEQHGERHGEQQDAQRGVPDPDGHGFHLDSRRSRPAVRGLTAAVAVRTRLAL